MKTQAEFDAAEQRWASQLRGRSLVVEADASPDEARVALEIIGRTYRLQGDRHRKAAVLRRYRSAYLVGVCSVATLYDVAGLWPYLERYFGALAQGDHQTLSDEFRAGLDFFGLARFHFPRRNIDEMLMHGGIPGPRTDEFIELLARRSAMTDGLNGRQFCQWVGGLSSHHAFGHGLDVATWRFLREGREVAEDVVDRALELLDRFAVANVTQADLTAFPAVMHADLLRALDELGEKQLKVRRRRRDQVDLVPRFSFSPMTGMQVRLPSVEHVTESRVEWAVAAEGRVGRVVVESPWPGDPVKSHFAAVSRPVKQLALTSQPGNQTWTLDVVDPDDPLLVFDGNGGEWIPARNSLPKSDVWVAFPNPDGLEISELLETQGGTWSPELLDAPLGWDGWLLARVSLSSVSSFRLVGHERWRYVSTSSRPQVEVADPVPVVRTTDGGRVFSAPPLVHLPPTPQSDGSASTVDWVVSVATLDGVALGSTTVSVGQSELRVGLPATELETLVGEFEIRVRGPLGRGTTRRLAIVSGLTTDASTSFRAMLTSGEGLTDAEVVVTAPFCDPQKFRRLLHKDEAAVTVEVCSGSQKLKLELEIPAMRIAVLGDGRPRTGHSAVSLDLEDLPATRLQVSLGMSGRSTLAAMKQGELLQTVQATASGPSGTAVFNLAQMSETLTRSGGATLVASVGAERVRVAQVRRKQLIAGAHLDEGVVILEELATDEPLEVAMYRRYAPWIAPTVARIDGAVGRFSLPPELFGEGEVRIVVEIDDPWAPREWPQAYPHRGLNAVDLDLGALTDSRGGVDAGFRSWLRRTAPCRTDVAGLSFAVELYANPDLAKFRTPRRELQHELALAIEPSLAHLPAAYSRAATQQQPVDLLVESSAVLLPPDRYAHGDELWDASPLLALLASGGSPRDDDATEGHLERVLGAKALEILAGGHDDAAAVGRFGNNEELLARMPGDRIDAIWRTMNPVPDRLLDDSTRLIAAKQLFDQRGRMVAGYRDAEIALVAARRALEDAYGPGALVPLEARLAKPGWTNLPAYSIGFCLVARAAARGHAASRLLHDTTRATLLDIARMAPAFVEQDLVLAELWTTRWSTR